MARLIDAEPILKRWNTESLGRREMYDMVKNAPMVDAVPVVRCKDCKHYAFTDNRVPQERVWWCYYWGYEIGADDYCSYGERRDDEIDRR